MSKKILFTPGEPAGIGFELAAKIAQEEQNYELIAVCDPNALAKAAKVLGVQLTLNEYQSGQPVKPSSAGELSIIPVLASADVVPGQLNVDNASYVIQTLQTAGELCLSGECDALVTGPVQKSIINESGLEFSGHTEFFADLSKTEKVVMMLATPSLRVALATTHLPLKDVSAAITHESLKEVITILHREMTTKFGIDKPEILVCGLNPHAGEGGHLGMEEIETITPVLDAFRKDGINLIGPLPADTLFTPPYLKTADAVLAMYHDQGLPVLKSHGFGEAVNITLGLPFIRTSVDHGTALNIAGQGKADTGSLKVALNYAFELAQASKQH